MKSPKLFSIALVLLFTTFISCDTSEPVKDVKGILTAKPWYFFSIDGGEAYECVKQTRINFLTNGTLEIDTYVRTPQYTCDGPFRTTYTYTLLDNNTKVEWGGEAFSIAKLTDTEFIKRVNRNGKDHEWVYLRK